MSGNPPAFPVTIKRNTSTDPLATPREIQFPGMTLRDWFAGQALAMSTHDSPKNLAEWAYLVADAMLAERAKATGGAS